MRLSQPNVAVAIHGEPFNGTFFASVAVVLPVLFLALALQSDYPARTMLFSRSVDNRSK